MLSSSHSLLIWSYRIGKLACQRIVVRNYCHREFHVISAYFSSHKNLENLHVSDELLRKTTTRYELPSHFSGRRNWRSQHVTKLFTKSTTHWLRTLGSYPLWVEERGVPQVQVTRQAGQVLVWEKCRKTIHNAGHGDTAHGIIFVTFPPHFPRWSPASETNIGKGPQAAWGVGKQCTRYKQK